jgi:hypothetical protein
MSFDGFRGVFARVDLRIDEDEYGGLMRGAAV